MIDGLRTLAEAAARLRRATTAPAPAPDTTILLLSRWAPETGWLPDDWSHAITEHELDELPPDEADRLLTALGVEDAGARTRISSWAGGWPLALVLGAEDAPAATTDTSWLAPAAEERRNRRLLRRLVPAALPLTHHEALHVAAIARTVDPALLGAVLGIDGHAGFGWLAESGLARATRGGLRLYALPRRALAFELARSEPATELRLRRAIVEHLYEQARDGRTSLCVELGRLSRNEALRVGFEWLDDPRYRFRPARAADAEILGAAMATAGRGRWWDQARRFVLEAPERVTVVSDAEHGPFGYCIAVTPENAPTLALDDPVLGPRIDHARRVLGTRNAVVWREAADSSRVTGHPLPFLSSALHVASVLRCGLPNPRFAYLSVRAGSHRWAAFLAATAAEHLAELDVSHAGEQLECHLVDFGPRGLLGAQRDVILYELGAAPPPFGVRAGRGRPAAEPDGVEEHVRAALRTFHRPDRLADNPLAVGSTVEDRVASVRVLLEDGLASAFGDAPAEQRLEQVLRRSYLDPTGNHERVALELHMSRTSYFRCLRQATARLAAHVEQGLQGDVR
ncbi:hypothetical protein [Patulibacter defluvii]|uniref:hypothetical protein n=1 Tax=Patulibacter defluvii TaxID=3095358 RepID=UPI002A765CD3|nr:hypothetical protein [Patulibacter sp. DM4]